MSLSHILFPLGLQRVLAPVLIDPDREFRHSELVARAGPGRGGGQNAIRSLLDAGIAKSRRSGNQVLVSADRSHPLFRELRSICLKTYGIADRVRLFLAPWSDRIGLAFACGPVVDGVGRADSSMRLVVVGDVELLDLQGALGTLECDLGRSVHLNLYRPPEWEAVRQGPGMWGLLTGARTMVIGDDPSPRDASDMPVAVPRETTGEPLDPKEALRYVAEAEVLLVDSRSPAVSPQGRFRLACDGIHCLALAVLVHYSGAETGGGTRRDLALQMLVKQAGLGTDAVRLVSRAHRMRDDFLTSHWEPPPSVADTEALVQVFGTTFAAVNFLVQAPSPGGVRAAAASQPKLTVGIAAGVVTPS